MTVQVAGIGFAAGPPARGNSGEAAARAVRVVIRIAVFILSDIGDCTCISLEVRVCRIILKQVIGCGLFSNKMKP
jgi:hypothetical protein